MQRRFFYLHGQPLVFLSAHGSGGKTPTEETTLALSRINHAMESLGGSIDDLVRTTVFTKNQECRPVVGEVRKKMLTQATRPASSSIIVHKFSPENTLVEIWATGILSRGKKYQKRGIEFEPPRPYLKALSVDDLLFLSGRGGSGESIEAQTRSSLDTIGETLAELGSSWDKVLLLTCYVKRLEWLDTVEKIASEHTHLGALSIELVPADEFARSEMLLEVEATAYL
jgi:enamine deaminase RidA (YjgF/YER057c/UK114 family)